MAQIPLVASEVTDHPLLGRFPDATIVEAEFLEEFNHMLVLGSLQRTREQVIPEKSERIRGNVTQILYEIPQQYTRESVIDFYREQMEEKGYIPMFTCEGRACGSSNYWANDIFRNRILYGPERNQFYLAMRTNFGIEDEPRMSVYIITRTNRRIYAYVEVIEKGGELPPINIVEPDAVLGLLRRDGSVVLPGVRFDANDRLSATTELDYLVTMLQLAPELNVYLVGHLRGAEPLAQLLQRSLSRAQALRQALIDLGIDGSRMDAQGVGPLAPACDAGECGDRIEMVLR